MKSFYKITPRGIELMEKLNQSLEWLESFGVDTISILSNELSKDDECLYKIFIEWYDFEFCDLDAIIIAKDCDLHLLANKELIKLTHEDND